MAVFCLRRKHTANASEPAVRKKRMSEECTHDCSSCGAACSSRNAAPQHDAPNPNSSVKKVIGVVSGKGGVGKSTTSVNLALALAALGKKVALFDADIYGPSVPTMLGYEGVAPVSYDGKTFQPFDYKGIASMSIGTLIPKDTALIWRGAKACGAIQQLLTEVNWGEIDSGNRRYPDYPFSKTRFCGSGHRFHTAGYCSDRCG